MKYLWMTLLLWNTAACAFSWQDLWSTSKQRAEEHMVQGIKQYRASEYQAAIKSFEQAGTGDGWYNLGNAWAKAGDYQQALKAYDEALKQNPEDADARFNRDLVSQLLQKQSSENNQTDSKNPDEKNNEEEQDKQSGKSEHGQNKDGDKREQQAGQQKSGGQTEQSEHSEHSEHSEQSRWLQLVPDDPGGLLREKFLRDYLKRHEGWYR